MAKGKAAKQSNGTATFIVSTVGAAHGPLRDKGGAQLQSGAIARFFGKKERSIEEVKAEVTKLSETVAAIAEGLKAKQASGFEMKTIEIGIAVSAEGTIGVASAGVEASITVTLERRSSS